MTKLYDYLVSVDNTDYIVRAKGKVDATDAVWDEFYDSGDMPDPDRVRLLKKEEISDIRRELREDDRLVPKFFYVPMIVGNY